MIPVKFKELLKLIYLPALVLSVLFSCSSTFFQLAQNSLFGSLHDPSQIPALKTLTLIPQIILVITLLLVAKSSSFEKLFSRTLIVFIGLIVFLSVCVFFQNYLALPTGFLQGETSAQYAPLLSLWPSTLFFLVAGLLNASLFSILTWGFVNRLVTTSDGIKSYLPLAFILGIGVALAPTLSNLFGPSTPWPFFALLCIALIFLILALLTFNWVWKKLPQDVVFPKETKTQTHFPYVSAAYLLAGCVMAENFLTLLLKSDLRMTLPTAAAYAQYMGSYSVSVGFTTIVASVVWVVLGSWLLLTQGWKKTALIGSIAALVGGLLSFVSLAWLSQGIIIGLLVATASALFFPLIQIVYLAFPYQLRFRAKVATEMIALPLLSMLPTLLVQGLYYAFGSLEALTLYLKILAPIFLALLIYATLRVSAKISRSV